MFWGIIKSDCRFNERKNFSFVGTNLTRCNAFFVQNDYVNLINIKLPNQNDLFNHTNSNIRESRDKDG